jgi:RNA polymerase sigma-70 factor (ECF subfamily)
MTFSPTTRYSLLLRIADPRNQAAWAEFVAIYEPLIYRLARRKGLQDADARDLCQDVFRAVAKAARRWVPDPARGSFRGWLYRIARNLLLNFIRHERRHPHGTGDSDVARLIDVQFAAADEPSRRAEEQYRRELFQLAAQAIEPEFTRSTWLAFWRTAVEAGEVAAVARELGLSPGAVYIAKSRVLARLRRRVEEMEGRESHG